MAGSKRLPEKYNPIGRTRFGYPPLSPILTDITFSAGTVSSIVGKLIAEK
jgi:hypothetical protein